MRGFGPGETLKVIWPGAKQTPSGYDDRTADPLPLFALLAPEKITAAIMGAVEALASIPLPPAERPARVAALEREIAALGYVEEALVEAAIARGEAVHRSASAPPAAVLGVKIVTPERRVA